MIGAIAANPHEGSRSEYLAQYVFASFGTAFAVPHHEDSGVDLYCTLTERVGQRLWPRAYFSVQVKSILESWTFRSEESVRWLITHPLPLFLCIVEKTSGHIRVYHTSPRFYLWSMPPLPQRIELIPTTDTQGKNTEWEGGDVYSLSAPILDFSISDILQDSFYEKAKQVLEFWISIDQANLHRIRTGIYSFTMPADYQTNSIEIREWSIQGKRNVGEQNIQQALSCLKELVAWLSSQLWHNGDMAGAVRGAILLRHLFKDGYLVHDPFLCSEINKLMGSEGKYLFSGIDELNDLLNRRLAIGAG
ncbi:MAG TPA: hypothetical protein VJ124_10570 [Pyrinomonadaceae bacterium]|nr:hypothetical protein [Pyrinomonadaceae bacterium]